MNPHAHMKLQSGVCMARHTVFDGIDLLFLDVKRETIQFFAKLFFIPLIEWFW